MQLSIRTKHPPPCWTSAGSRQQQGCHRHRGQAPGPVESGITVPYVNGQKRWISATRNLIRAHGDLSEGRFELGAMIPYYSNPICYIRVIILIAPDAARSKYKGVGFIVLCENYLSNYECLD